MCDSADDLRGIYHISMTEMPPPWELTQEIFGGAGPVIAYEQLTPVLVKSIQELKAEIDALKAEIEELKK